MRVIIPFSDMIVIMMMTMMINFFYRMFEVRKTSRSLSEAFSEVFTIAKLKNAVGRIWTCAELEFRRCWIKLCSSDNHCTTVSQGKLFFTNFNEKSALLTVDAVTGINIKNFSFLDIREGTFSSTFVKVSWWFDDDYSDLLQKHFHNWTSSRKQSVSGHYLP